MTGRRCHPGTPKDSVPVKMLGRTQMVSAVLLSGLLLHFADANYLSVTGKELEKCSGPGMALTGFTRTGQCVAHDDDAGSHHVCIDMASNSGGNFCTVTGQPDWCSSQMGCDGGGGKCPIEHWCLPQRCPVPAPAF